MDWLEWQRKVIREEYVKGERQSEENLRFGENRHNTGWRKVAGYQDVRKQA
jgi:hypothetical protein